jgi:hypothetical protein
MRDAIIWLKLYNSGTNKGRLEDAMLAPAGLFMLCTNLLYDRPFFQEIDIRCSVRLLAETRATLTEVFRLFPQPLEAIAERISNR